MVLERWRPSLDAIPWRPFGTPSDAEEGWAPALDIFEKDARFIVKIEIPGMKEDDIEVSTAGNTLTIKGEKKSEEIEQEDYYHVERFYGKFTRSIALPLNINTDNIEAKYENGVLEVSLPKGAATMPKKVKVAGK